METTFQNKKKKKKKKNGNKKWNFGFMFNHNRFLNFEYFGHAVKLT